MEALNDNIVQEDFDKAYIEYLNLKNKLLLRLYNSDKERKILEKKVEKLKSQWNFK